MNSQSSLNKKKRKLEDFKILRSLGDGAFGEVYLAKCKATGDKFALKSINKNFLKK